ncbi:DUF4258 domain-containing protein [Aureispira anguillae]|nr:DUF4258 domain-containing protein [Aureispira anguillae]
MENKSMLGILFHPYFRIIMVAIIVLLLLNSCEYGPEHGNSVTTTQNEKPSGAKNQERPGGTTTSQDAPTEPVAPKEFTERDLEFKGNRIALTHHARCRMDCRKIDAFEIQEVIDKNTINYKKTRPAKPGKCPTIAYEGMTRDNQNVRVIVGDCENDPIIITVIDLGNKYHCTCD